MANLINCIVVGLFLLMSCSRLPDHREYFTYTSKEIQPEKTDVIQEQRYSIVDLQ